MGGLSCACPLATPPGGPPSGARPGSRARSSPPRLARLHPLRWLAPARLPSRPSPALRSRRQPARGGVPGGLALGAARGLARGAAPQGRLGVSTPAQGVKCTTNPLPPPSVLTGSAPRRRPFRPTSPPPSEVGREAISRPFSPPRRSGRTDE